MPDRPPAFAAPDPEALSAAFRRVAERFLARIAAPHDEPVIERVGSAAIDGLAALPPLAGRPLDEVVAHLLDTVCPLRTRTDHPRFFAFIPSPASPLSPLGDLLTAIHNPHAGNWLQSAGPAAIEHGLVRFMADAAGLPATADGLFVSGGSMANLTALVAARDRMLAEDERAQGVAYLSTQTHSSVGKALRIIGLLDRRIRVLAVDDRFRMDVGALEVAVAEDRAAGLKPFVVVASAGTTNTGAIDPLPQLADICARENLWLHVDGAFGASALLSAERRALLAGIERADSLSWDAHKWLFQTYGCGVALVRDRTALTDAFRTGPDYLRDAETDGGESNFWDLGLELTRPARALKLWLTLQAMGLDAVGEAISHGFGMAEHAERTIAATPGWRVVTPAQMAIVTFRCEPYGLSEEERDTLNAAAARRLLDDGFAAVGTTRLDGRLVLRICAINPQTKTADVEETIRRLDSYVRAAVNAARGKV
jgi:glutamate/tyrosine decarboxylase-like PLP-dependent enzyme